MRSVWMQDEPRRFDALQGDKSTDVLIVGGGIAGVLCAYKLKKAGVDCVLAEEARIGSGITQNTTAKITVGHGLLYADLIRRFGEEKARGYLAAQLRAGEEYEALCRDIDCDYEKKDSYVYSLKSSEEIRKEVKALRLLGADACFAETEKLPFHTAGAVCVKRQAQFHPLKFLYAIAKDLPIYEHTKVLTFAPNRAKTDRGTLCYNKLIIATHFPILNKYGGYFLKLYQHRSYVIALKGAEDVEGMYVDASGKGLSFRNYGDLLLLGGGGHRTGKRGGGWAELERFAKEHYKHAQTVGRWATQDCMTLDGVPYIGRYAKALPNVFTATGFNKWGMTNAMVAADLLCDLAQERENPLAEVFSPSRSILRPKLAANLCSSALHLLTPTAPRCSHLGCALKYNAAEHSWDCPCHGSRFAEDGALLDNPATADKRMGKKKETRDL